MQKAQLESSGELQTSCPLCGKIARTRVGSHEAGRQRYELYHCLACDVQFWDPRVGGDSEYYANEGMSLYKAIHAGGNPAEKDARFRFFWNRYSGATPGRILDMGCGSGHFLEQAIRRGYEGWGIDFDPISIDRARERGLQNVFCQSIETFVETNTGLEFDHITAFDVIEHLADPLPVLTRLRSLLKPNGLITVTVPNRHRILVNQMKSDFPPHHFFRFNEASLAQCLRLAGFVDAEAKVFEYGYALPVALDVVVKSLRSLRASSPAASSGSASKNTTTSESSSKRIFRKVVDLSAKPSSVIETALGRGFKVFATGRRSDADAT